MSYLGDTSFKTQIIPRSKQSQYYEFTDLTSYSITFGIWRLLEILREAYIINLNKPPKVVSTFQTQEKFFTIDSMTNNLQEKQTILLPNQSTGAPHRIIA